MFDIIYICSGVSWIYRSLSVFIRFFYIFPVTEMKCCSEFSFLQHNHDKPGSFKKINTFQSQSRQEQILTGCCCWQVPSKSAGLWGQLSYLAKDGITTSGSITWCIWAQQYLIKIKIKQPNPELFSSGYRKQ